MPDRAKSQDRNAPNRRASGAAIGSDPELGVLFARWGDMDDSSRAAWFARMRADWGADLLGGYARLCFPRPLRDDEVVS